MSENNKAKKSKIITTAICIALIGTLGISAAVNVFAENDDNSNGNVSSSAVSSENALGEDTSSEGSLNEGTSSDDTSSKDTSSKDTSSTVNKDLDTSSKYTSSTDTSSESTSSKDTSSESTSSKDTSSTATSSESTSSKDTSSADTSSESTSSKDTSSADTSSESTSSEDTSSKDEDTVTWKEEKTNKTFYISEDCNVRLEAIVGSEVVSTLSQWDKVEVVAKTDTEYYKIADGKYIHESFVTTEEPPAWTEEKVSKTLYVTEKCNVRKEAIVGAEIVSSLSKDDEVKVIAKTSTEYYKIADGKYIHEDFLTSKKPVTTTDKEDTSTDKNDKDDKNDNDNNNNAPAWTETKVEKTLYVTEKCSVRKEAIVGAKAVSTLSKGDEVKVVAKTSTEYYKISDGKYVHEDFLTSKKPASTSDKEDTTDKDTSSDKNDKDNNDNTPAWTETKVEKTLYVTESCNVRKEAIVGAKVVSSLSRGDKVEVIAKTNTEYYKLGNGKYVHEDFLSTKKPSSGSVSNNTSQNGSISSGTPKSILNSASLNPRKTGVAVLDNKVDAIFNSIFPSGADTYTKVKACYDYLINNTSYQTGVYYPTDAFGNISVEGSTNYVNWAAMSLFASNKGSCNRYSAAFIVMLRRIGIEASYISGQTSSSGGGYTGHNWVEAYINGKTYVFDPQVEDNIAGGGTIRYLRFCKTYAEVPGKFIK